MGVDVKQRSKKTTQGQNAPKFEIFDDRIEITSIGGLPNGLSQEDFFEGYSIQRNKGIMRIYKDLELVEQLGSGVPRILDAYDKDCFKFSDNFLRITFPKSISGAISGAIESLTERQVEILELIKENNKIAYRDVAQRLEINNSAVQAHFNTLKKKGIIKRIGGTRGYWEVLKG